MEPRINATTNIIALVRAHKNLMEWRKALCDLLQAEPLGAPGAIDAANFKLLSAMADLAGSQKRLKEFFDNQFENETVIVQNTAMTPSNDSLRVYAELAPVANDGDTDWNRGWPYVSCVFLFTPAFNSKGFTVQVARRDSVVNSLPPECFDERREFHFASVVADAMTIYMDGYSPTL